MTEEQWLACTDPKAMLDFLRGQASDRKLRLFAVACCRNFWHLVEDERSRKAVEVSERFADGVATRKEVRSARRELKADFRNKRRVAIAKGVSEQRAAAWAFGWDIARYTLRAKSCDAASLGILGFAPASGQQNRPVEWLRDVFGNPFRPVAIDPAWFAWDGGAVRKLAQGIYDERAFDHLPILADALEEAGCDQADLLAHLRGPGPHVRGCWALDLLLGKS
jgi:hypothetical protein